MPCHYPLDCLTLVGIIQIIEAAVYAKPPAHFENITLNWVKGLESVDYRQEVVLVIGQSTLNFMKQVGDAVANQVGMAIKVLDEQLLLFDNLFVSQSYEITGQHFLMKKHISGDDQGS